MKKMILVGMMVIVTVCFTGCGHHVTITTEEKAIEKINGRLEVVEVEKTIDEVVIEEEFIEEIKD